MPAREVMKPRAEMIFVLTTDSARTLAQRAIATGRTRLPLCEPDGGLESAPGAINTKDLLRLIFEDAQRLQLFSLARPLAHISESARIDEVLREMREGRVHRALVHDEHGTVIGLLTMEASSRSSSARSRTNSTPTGPMSSSARRTGCTSMGGS